jgi:hypothetical protein
MPAGCQQNRANHGDNAATNEVILALLHEPKIMNTPVRRYIGASRARYVDIADAHRGIHIGGPQHTKEAAD